MSSPLKLSETINEIGTKSLPQSPIKNSNGSNDLRLFKKNTSSSLWTDLGFEGRHSNASKSTRDSQSDFDFIFENAIEVINHVPNH